MPVEGAPSSADLQQRLARAERALAEAREALAETQQREAEAAARETLAREREAEAHEQQTATGEILRVIASSPSDLQPVLDAVAENSARLCEAEDAIIFRVEGDCLRAVAHHGPVPMPIDTERVPLIRALVSGRAVIDRQTVHVPDSEAEPEDEFPVTRAFGRRFGHRTTLGTPLLREGVPLGVILIRRRQVRPFTDQQIKLLETFADQAVIAIGNARLFAELQDRNRELQASNRDLTEALEQQTATADILRVIASSPTEVQSVLATIAQSALRLTGSDYALVVREEPDGLRPWAVAGAPRTDFVGEVWPIDRSSVTGRAFVDRRTIHVHDLAAESEEEYAYGKLLQRRGQQRTVLSTPLLREGHPIGAINIARLACRPYTENQIKLIETFADQAVIAIENTRLFGELQERNRDLTEALEQQTATAEVLRVIASSPTDLQRVLDSIVQSAARICDGEDTKIALLDGEMLRPVASYGPLAAIPRRLSRGFPAGRAVVDCATVHIHDLAAESEDEWPEGKHSFRLYGQRTQLVTPLRREGSAIGSIFIRRMEVRPFTDQQIRLLESFADQAVIAIENARLFQALEDRNQALSDRTRDLTEALERQTATGDILRVIASSPTELQPVLDAVAESAARLCGGIDAQIFRVEGDLVRKLATHGPVPVTFDVGEAMPISPEHVLGRAVLDRAIIHVPDFEADSAAQFPEAQARARRAGYRAVLAVPMLREARVVGVIAARRTEAGPFTQQQIRLLETFADQAVIAIENVRLFQDLQARNRDLSQALEQQTATGEILRVIASSPTDLQPVLNAITESAARLCEASGSVIVLIQGDARRAVEAFGTSTAMLGTTRPLDVRDVTGRAIRECRTVQARDLADDLERETEYPDSAFERHGNRTVLFTPLMRTGVAIGALGVDRREARPFADQQIRLLETFADQAAIAIENTRLFQELQDRNRDLSETLEQQTATAEILRIISSSPADLKPILEAVAGNAARLCGAVDAHIYRVDGDSISLVASHGSLAAPREMKISRGSVTGRAVVDRRTFHVYDLAAESENEFPAGRSYQTQFGHRTTLATPLLREGVPLGAIMIRRLEVRPFTERQIELLETFADQAVIAIENTRLFQELQERVEELRALGEVGQTVSATLDLQQVLNTVVSHADQLSGTDGGVLYEYDETSKEFQLRATRQFDPAIIETLRAAPILLGEGAVGRAAIARAPVQIPDITAGGVYTGRLLDLMSAAGHRAVLAVPLLREDRILGGLVVVRKTPGAFPNNVVALVQTFASQSALAIQNARLYREIENKSLQLELASQHKSEFLANMSHELRTPLNAIIGFSEVLLERMFGELNDKQAEYQQDILSSGQHLLSLINDILDLSKVEAGQMALEIASFSLRAALENGLTIVKERASRHRISLGLEVEPNLDLIGADERKVKQVVFNLLSNAVKFTPDGGRVDVCARAVDGAVEVAVRDTGIGIATADQPYVFDEFRQVGQGAARAEGSGLGLALSKRFAELHGGRLRVESEPGRGSTFTFTLPQPAADETRRSR